MFCFPHPTEEWTGLLKIYINSELKCHQSIIPKNVLLPIRNICFVQTACSPIFTQLKSQNITNICKPIHTFLTKKKCNYVYAFLGIVQKCNILLFKQYRSLCKRMFSLTEAQRSERGRGWYLKEVRTKVLVGEGGEALGSSQSARDQSPPANRTSTSHSYRTLAGCLLLIRNMQKEAHMISLL